MGPLGIWLHPERRSAGQDRAEYGRNQHKHDDRVYHGCIDQWYALDIQSLVGHQRRRQRCRHLRQGKASH